MVWILDCLDHQVQQQAIFDRQFKIVKVLCKWNFKMIKIYLFESQAIGASHADSDYDLFLVVKNSDRSRIV